MKKSILSIGLLVMSLSASAETTDITVYVTRTPVEQSIDTRSYTRADSLEQLEQSPGINIVQSGPRGQNTSMFVRGTESDHTLLAINGMPIKDHSTISGSDDIGQHSLAGIDQLLFIRGPAGSAYGPNAVGGAVDFISRGTSDSVSVSTGTYGYKNLYGSKRFVKDSFAGSIAVETEHANGIDIQDNGDQDSYTKKNINLYGSWMLGQGDFYLNYIQSDNSSDLDGWNNTSNWQFDNTQLGYETQDSRLIYNQANHKRTYDTSNVYLSSDARLLTEKTWNQWTVSLEHSNHTYDNNSRTEQGAAVAYNNQWLSAELRSDDTELGSFASWRLGVSHSGLRASVANGFRTPSLYEVYGDDLYVEENTSLQAEYITAYELGYRNSWVDTALFFNQETDRITYVTDPETYVGQYSNNVNDTVRTHGVETSLTKTVEDVTVNYNYTYTWSDADKLRQPAHMHNLALLYRGLTYSAQYIGSHLDTDSNTFATVNMSDVLLQNLSYKEKWLTVGVNNITDQQYQRPDGYRQYGRTITLKADYEF